MAAMDEGDRRRLAAMGEWQQRSGAYLQLQGTRPQTIAHALADSPAGLLAWIVEKFQEWTDPAAALPEDAVDRDRILTNVSVYCSPPRPARPPTPITSGSTTRPCRRAGNPPRCRPRRPSSPPT
jgi:hypothetical protein